MGSLPVPLLIGSPDGQCSMANFCWNFRDFSESCTMAGVDSGQTRVPSAVFLQVFTSKSIRFSKLECEANEGSRLSSLAQETYTVNISTAPEPPSHLDIFHLHLRVYANPYVLHKYDLLEPVLCSVGKATSHAMNESPGCSSTVTL